MQNSFTCTSAELINQQGGFLIKAQKNSLPCWFMLLVSEPKLPVFKGLLNFLPLNLPIQDYGKIIIDGNGENPPAQIAAQIKNGDFSDKNPEKLSEVFCILANTENGEEFYTYLDVPYYLFEKFKLASQSRTVMEYTEYGEILHSGWGKPTPEIAQMMSEKFGIETTIF